MAYNIKPYREDDAFSQIDRIFDRMRRSMLAPYTGDDAFLAGENGGFSLDISENEGEVTVEAALPGVKNEQIDVRVEDNVLTIATEARNELEEQDEERGWHRREIRYGKMQRSVRLPAEVDADAAEANLVDGILRITLPKVNPVPPKRIIINHN